MSDEIPCLFCYSKPTTSEEYPDEIVKSEAERIYKLLCSLLGVNLTKAEDVFYQLCTISFLPLCKECSLIFRNLSEFASAPSYLDPKGNPKIKAIMEQQMQSVADEIRVKVQYSGDRIQFAFPQLTTAGPSETGSNEESNSRAWFNKIQTFRKSVIEGGRITNVTGALILEEVPVICIKEEVVIKEEEVEPFYSVEESVENTEHKDILSGDEKSPGTTTENQLLMVDLEQIINIKYEQEKGLNEESDITSENGSNYDELVYYMESDVESLPEQVDKNDPDWKLEIENDSDSTKTKKEAVIKTRTQKKRPNRTVKAVPLKTKKSSRKTTYRNYMKRGFIPFSKAITKSGGFECDICNVSFASEINLQQHKGQNHLVKKTISSKTNDIEKTEIASPALHQDLLDKLQNNQKFKCDECILTFASIGSLSRHLVRFHSPEQPSTKTDDVKKPIQSSKRNSIKQNDQVSNSSQNDTKKLKLIESSCPKTPQATPDKLPSKKIIYKCEKCNLTFSNRSSLSRHNGRFHTPGKILSKASAARLETIKNKTANKTVKQRTPFKCSECTESYAFKGNLQRHIRKRHSDAIKKNPQKLHISSSGRRPPKPQKEVSIECDHCNTIFTSEIHLMRHISRIGTGPQLKEDKTTSIAINKKQRICPVCQEVFLDASNLNRHIKTIHFNSKLFKCSECERTFNRRDTLTVHQRRYHSTQS